MKILAIDSKKKKKKAYYLHDWKCNICEYNTLLLKEFLQLLPLSAPPGAETYY